MNITTNPASEAGVVEVIDITSLHDNERRFCVVGLSGATLATGYQAEIEAALGRPLLPILDSLWGSFRPGAQMRPGSLLAAACPFACRSAL